MVTLCMAARPASAAAGPGLPAQARLRQLDLPAMAESATEVRQRVAHAQGIAHLVPPGVASYIDRHHLYQPA